MSTTYTIELGLGELLALHASLKSMTEADKLADPEAHRTNAHLRTKLERAFSFGGTELATT